MQINLKNKVAIVTGAGRGIGRVIAATLAAEGAITVAVALRQDLLDETSDEWRQNGWKGAHLACDIRRKAQCDDVARAIVDRFGRIDILVNNAGIVADAQLKKMTDEQFDRVIDINLKGTYNCTKAVVDIMLEQQSGVILNASSIVGLYGNFGQTNYAASKFGVIGMVKTWARELGKRGIRANAVCPGFVSTSIIDSIPDKVIDALENKVPLGRLGKPEEIANAYAFLASDEASYINGAVLEVSGGLTI
jgi:3-oxoacyl-[acyl-carrier protein] reductase